MEELMPSMQFRLKTTDRWRMYPWYLEAPEPGPLLVALDPAVQVDLHPHLPPQSAGIIASGETRLTSAGRHVLLWETS